MTGWIADDRPLDSWVDPPLEDDAPESECPVSLLNLVVEALRDKDD